MLDFPLLKKITYLDSAATTQTPQQVLKEISNYYTNVRSNVHRGVYAISEETTKQYENTRKTVATFINASPEEIIFTSGTTESINILALMLESSIKKENNIVITELEHNSNSLPWRLLAQRKKIELRVMPINNDGTLNLQESLIDDKTAIVAMSHASNLLGNILPVEKLCKLAKKHNALSIIDAAQSVAHGLVDAKKLQADFVVFSGHKMLGPTGIGVLYGRKTLLDGLEPAFVGGGMVSAVTKEKLTWMETPYKFEAGTPNIAGVLGLNAAIQYLTKELPLLAKKETEITKHFLIKAKEHNLEVYGPKERLPIFSFNIPGIHSHDVASILAQENICVRAGHHCAQPLLQALGIQHCVRASFYLYNTTKDVDKLFEGIENVKRKLQ